MASVVLHAHFYQPPRDNPFLERVDREPSAAPYHDWNQRIEQECYRPVQAARVLGPAGGIARNVNLLERVSFNFGPTLLEWLEREARATYRGILAADRASRARLGHGNAIAQPYHHAILPLASRRDKVTEVRWGMADFRRRFGRDPEGMWLPETAADEETLEVLAEEGIAFTVLAPHQVERRPERGLPGLWRSGSRRLALFLYDGALSHGVAFGELLADGHAWAERMQAALPAGEEPALVALATDGETYGHHHKFAEMALAAMLLDLERRPRARVENFAAFLARSPASEPVRLAAPSSWSCSHGVERWRSACGCGAAPGYPSQEWRRPLRAALEWLAGRLHQIFEREGTPLLGDVWAARDACGEAVGADAEAWRQHATRLAAAQLPPEARVRALELLEMERDVLRLFTSCAWFFEDVGRLEAAQVLRYAAHALSLAGAAQGTDAEAIEAGFVERLAEARSNDPAVATAREVYRERVLTLRRTSLRVAAAAAAIEQVTADVPARRIGGFDIFRNGERLSLRHRRTGRVSDFETAVTWGGGGRLTIAARDVAGTEALLLAPTDLPEIERERLLGSIQARLVERALDAEDAERLRLGLAPLDALLRPALTRAVEGLEVDRSAGAIARVHDLLDLLELRALTIPFDAQSAIAHLRDGLQAADASGIEALARRLGFEGAG